MICLIYKKLDFKTYLLLLLRHLAIDRVKQSVVPNLLSVEQKRIEQKFVVPIKPSYSPTLAQGSPSGKPMKRISSIRRASTLTQPSNPRESIDAVTTVYRAVDLLAQTSCRVVIESALWVHNFEYFSRSRCISSDRWILNNSPLITMKKRIQIYLPRNTVTQGLLTPQKQFDQHHANNCHIEDRNGLPPINE